MINRRDFVKPDLIEYDSFILNYRFDDRKVGNISYNFDYVRLK